MSDTLFLLVIVEMGAVSGAFYLSERKSKSQGRTVKPSPTFEFLPLWSD